MSVEKCIIELSSCDTYQTMYKIWHTHNQHTKHKIIYHVFLTRNVELAESIIKFFLDDYDKNSYNLMYTFVNLLVVVLASTHLPQYLKYVIWTKQIGDVFFYIDSNLLFEFSPVKNSDKPIEDTFQNLDMICQHLSDADAKLYKYWVKYYSKEYNNELVIRQWLKYKTPIFKLHIEERLNDIAHE